MGTSNDDTESIPSEHSEETCSDGETYNMPIGTLNRKGTIVKEALTQFSEILDKIIQHNERDITQHDIYCMHEYIKNTVISICEFFVDLKHQITDIILQLQHLDDIDWQMKVILFSRLGGIRFLI